MFIVAFLQHIWFGFRSSFKWRLCQKLLFFFSFILLYLVFPPPFCFRKEKNAVQLDDEGGRTFLRVLIHLIMHDYPPLLSGALHLLFKHFSQRAEVLQAFKQVWMGIVLFQETWLQGKSFQRLLYFPKSPLIISLEAQIQERFVCLFVLFSLDLTVCSNVYYGCAPRNRYFWHCIHYWKHRSLVTGGTCMHLAVRHDLVVIPQRQS